MNSLGAALMGVLAGAAAQRVRAVSHLLGSLRSKTGRQMRSLLPASFAIIRYGSLGFK